MSDIPTKPPEKPENRIAKDEPEAWAAIAPRSAGHGLGWQRVRWGSILCSTLSS